MEKSVLETILEDEDPTSLERDLDEDVEMFDAEEPLPGDEKVYWRGANKKKKKKKKKKKRTKDGGGGGYAPSITDINRFVLQTSKRLKEKKSYLIWNAVACLGVSAVGDLVKEVEAIQSCGGQKTADQKRYRTGGGILWKMLKARDPNAYKEIMAKGREFEKQLIQPQRKLTTTKQSNGGASTVKSVGEKVPPPPSDLVIEADDGGDAKKTAFPIPERVSVMSRIRVPVAYDDLFEEGEIPGSCSSSSPR